VRVSVSCDPRTLWGEAIITRTGVEHGCYDAAHHRVLPGRRLAGRGSAAPARPQPILSDSEVLTIECVGEFWGIDTDKGLYEHFRRHWRDWFPALSRIHRTTFVRQAANLWATKHQLRQQLLGQISFDPAISILDSFPMPVCRFGRAYRCRRLAELASFGRDEGAKQTYYGLRRICGCAGQG
jgi:hypothetical protein